MTEEVIHKLIKMCFCQYFSNSVAVMSSCQRCLIILNKHRRVLVPDATCNGGVKNV